MLHNVSEKNNNNVAKKSAGCGTVTTALRSDSQRKIRRLDSYWPRCYCTGLGTQKLHSVFNQRQIHKTKSLCDFKSLKAILKSFRFSPRLSLETSITVNHETRIHLPWSCHTRSRTKFTRSPFFTFTGCLWTVRGKRRDADGNDLYPD